MCNVHALLPTPQYSLTGNFSRSQVRTEEVSQVGREEASEVSTCDILPSVTPFLSDVRTWNMGHYTYHNFIL